MGVVVHVTGPQGRAFGGRDPGCWLSVKARWSSLLLSPTNSGPSSYLYSSNFVNAWAGVYGWCVREILFKMWYRS